MLPARAVPAITYMKRDKSLATDESAFICHPMRPAAPPKWGCRPSIRLLGVFLQPGTAKVKGFFAWQAFCLRGLNVLLKNRSHRLGPPSVLLRGELYYLISFGDGKLHGFLVHVVPGRACFRDPFLVHLLDGFLDILREGIPLLLVHSNEKAERVRRSKVLSGAFGHFDKLPTLEGLHGGEQAVYHAFFERVIGFGLRHRDGSGPKGTRHFCTCPRASYLHAFQIFHLGNRLLGVNYPGAMAVEVHYLDVIQLFWLKFLIIRIAQLGYLRAAFVALRKIDNLGEGESSFRVAEDRHADVGNPLDHSVIALVRRSQSGARIHVDLDCTVGSLLDFF